MNHYLASVAFVAGLVTMGLEILGFRLFAPYFGYSVYVSGTLISVIMIALALGYYLGGCIADRKPRIWTLHEMMLGSIVYLIAMALAYKYILSFFSGVSQVWGTFASGLVIFGPPMLLLSMVSPFIVKLTAKKKYVGMAAGKVSAVGTIGAIIGTLATTFLLIPMLGSFAALVAMIVLLVIVTVMGLASSNRFSPALLLVALLFLVPQGSAQANTLFEQDSVYNHVMVEQSPSGNILLKLNSEKWVHTLYNPEKELTQSYIDYLMAGPMIAHPESILILGMGAGGSVNHYMRFTNASITAVEIDPVVVDAAHKYFNVPQNDPRVEVVVDDARPFMERNTRIFDLVEVDMYHGGIFIPFYVLTKEFFQLTYKSLDDDGVMVMNVYAPQNNPKRYILANSIGKTIGQFYPSVFSIDLTSNIILVATRKETTLNNLRNRISRQADPLLQQIQNDIESAIVPFNPPEGAIVLTDDYAPIEQLTQELLSA